MEKKVILATLGIFITIFILVLTWIVKMLTTPDEPNVQINYGISFTTCIIIMAISIGFGMSVRNREYVFISDIKPKNTITEKEKSTIPKEKEKITIPKGPEKEPEKEKITISKEPEKNQEEKITITEDI